jgi:hypothetical protein
VLLLVPSDSLRPASPDDHFAREFRAAGELGLPTALIDHDALTQLDDAARAARWVTVPSDDAVYRGWMVTAEQYAALEQTLGTRSVRLRTNARCFKAAHELPGWYEIFAALTPRSVWVPIGRVDTIADVVRGALRTGPGVVKDYVKSMKHYWHEAAYVSDLHDQHALGGVVSRLVELRGDDLVGGVVVREFEDLEPGEARTWWVDGACRLVTAHPDTPEQHPGEVDVSPIAACVQELGSPFVTVDLARDRDGRLRVVEVGDGQVSDLPSSVEPEDLVRALAR